MHIVTFVGDFQMWAYTVSHACLLLRSPKSPSRGTQIDVLFKNVAAIRLPVSFTDLEIAEEAVEDAEPAIDTGRRGFGDRKLYALRGVAWRGAVVAGVAVWHEGHEGYSQRSPLWPFE
jgi:hypothetical protein